MTAANFGQEEHTLHADGTVSFGSGPAVFDPLQERLRARTAAVVRGEIAATTQHLRDLQTELARLETDGDR
jgi:hypothetical protein